jgi:hypothetical protein
MNVLIFWSFREKAGSLIKVARLNTKRHGKNRMQNTKKIVGIGLALALFVQKIRMARTTINRSVFLMVAFV